MWLKGRSPSLSISRQRPFAERDCEPSLVAPDSVVQSYLARRQILWTPEQST